ncbi:MAG TPA: glycoside hydrolase family 65 protein [Mycobacteriales bacterium]|nr:glycoside hydrolase family 65 protein [Mycobacteriales bacterium]
MIEQSAYPVEPWMVRETSLSLDLLAQSESVFALSNGHIGMRGNLDEGEPHGIPGTYLNSFYEQRPLPYAEAGYGYPDSGQTIVNVTNGKLIRVLVDDEPLDVRYGELHHHERLLDLRAGTLTRSLEWASPADQRIRVKSTRLVSFVQRAVAAIEYVVEPIDAPARFVIQSEIVANDELTRLSGDPRVSAILENPLVAVEHAKQDYGGILLHHTRASNLSMAAGTDHIIEGPGRLDIDTDARDDWVRTTVVANVRPGDKLRLVKLLAYGWSSLRSRQSLRDQVAAALRSARYSGFDGLLEEQRAYLDEFWESADVEVDGDPEIQQAVRFGLFHVLQSGARAERRCIAAKGLTGPGYDGHTFWDTEGFVLPVLTYTQPSAAADAIRWRHSTLDLAKEHAAKLGLRGAAFPWRTIRGHECSGYWPAGTAAFHINADIADAVERYRIATGDDAVDRGGGVELLVETARLWMSLGHHDVDGFWHVDGVTGPDEYSAIADDNIFTNLMAARNLEAAADATERHPDLAAELSADADEVASWRDAAAAVFIPYDEKLGVHPQSEGYTRHEMFDFERYRDRYPLLLTAPYFDLYRKQVLKQADLVLAMHWCGDRFTFEDKARNVDYYERRTVRDSSLSACTQAVMAAEVGHLQLAHDYAYEAAMVDLRDLHHNSRDGLHMASLAGAWIALVAGFGGLRDHGKQLMFDPALPPGINRLSFSIRWRGIRLRVAFDHDEVTYSLHDGDHGRVELHHDGEDIVVTDAEPVVRPLKPRHPLLPEPSQPVGREPARRDVTEAETGRGISQRSNA